jgi:tRNA nucleotidyltransferase (CCA-adding enzyme)
VKNLKSIIDKQLPKDIALFLRAAGKAAADNGDKLYLVGGTVRDLLLKRSSLDIDLALEGNAVKFARQMAAETGEKLTIHQRFGTANFRHGEFTIDIAMARRETYAHPGALPTVKPAKIKDDSGRRDFSVNAMAVDLSPDMFGQLLDFHGGISDLDKKLIRILHKRSFTDDATRIFRAIRYEQRLGFAIEDGTERLLRKKVAMINTVSGDRIRNEIELLLKEESPEKGLARADELGVLRQINRSLKSSKWLAERFEEARRHYIAGLAVYFALLCHDLVRDDAEAISERLNLSGDWKRIVLGIARINEDIHKLADPAIQPSAVYRYLKRYPVEVASACFLSNDSRIVRGQIERYLKELQYIRIRLDGNELKGMGVKPGPRMGRLLKALQDAQLDGLADTREEEETFVRYWLQTHK